MKKGITSTGTMLILSIIVIIAFIVIPPMFARIAEQERISLAKKGYATFANAMTMVRSWGGDYIFDLRRDTPEDMEDWYLEFLEPNLQITKTCYDTSGCWNEYNTVGLNKINVYNNRKGVGIGQNIITAILKDGSFINLDLCSKGAVWKYYGVQIYTRSGLVIHYDINGADEPNMLGKDIFVAVFTEDGLVPAYRDQTANKVMDDCSEKGFGNSCLKVYLRKP